MNFRVFFLIYALFLSGCVITESQTNENYRRYRPSNTDYYLTKKEFFSMASTGVSEKRIEEMLLKNPKGFSLTLDEIVELRKLGISNRLIKIALAPQKYRTLEARPTLTKRKVSKEKEGAQKISKDSSQASQKDGKKPSSLKNEDNKGKTGNRTETLPKDPKKRYPSLFYYGYEDEEGKSPEDEEEIGPPFQKKKK